MKVLITGSESFVGKELISKCIKEGIFVYGIDLLDEPSQKYEYKKGDIRESDILNGYTDVDAIIHLAAVSRWTDCSKNLKQCFDINVLGTINLIDLAIAKNIPKFIFASSEFVYGEDPELKTEESPIIFQKVNSYGLSKLVIEDFLKSKANLISVSILRFGIIYGPRKSNFSAVESLFNAVRDNIGIEVGSLETGRNFIHVSDIARGIIKSLKLTGFNVVNLAGEKYISLNDIINESIKIWGTKPELKVIGSPPSIHKVSSAKAKEVIDWMPEIDLYNGLSSLK